MVLIPLLFMKSLYDCLLFESGYSFLCFSTTCSRYCFCSSWFASTPLNEWLYVSPRSTASFTTLKLITRRRAKRKLSFVCHALWSSWRKSAGISSAAKSFLVFIVTKSYSSRSGTSCTLTLIRQRGSSHPRRLRAATIAIIRSSRIKQYQASQHLAQVPQMVWKAMYCCFSDGLICCPERNELLQLLQIIPGSDIGWLDTGMCTMPWDTPEEQNRLNSRRLSSLSTVGWNWQRMR